MTSNSGLFAQLHRVTCCICSLARVGKAH
ncbi:hypothetical protein M2366_003210 [Aeromonas sp. BIGb0405]|nr:hypothetical protein [Aeromonas sp. BIGb0405]